MTEPRLGVELRRVLRENEGRYQNSRANNARLKELVDGEYTAEELVAEQRRLRAEMYERMGRAA